MAMKISGIQKLTLLDYPGKVAATIFTSGCNFRCPFCQNADLVIDAENSYDMSREEILAYLQKRKGLLDGVCVTGGEPLINSDIEDFLYELKDMGYSVKLDTNGSAPDLLMKIVGEGLADYVAMDIKNCRERYGETAGITGMSTAAIEKSAAFLMENTVPFEFRTTVVKEFHDADSFKAIGQWLRGEENYYLQAFVDSERVISPGLHGYSPQELEKFCEILKRYIPNARLRGV